MGAGTDAFVAGRSRTSRAAYAEATTVRRIRTKASFTSEVCHSRLERGPTWKKTAGRPFSRSDHPLYSKIATLALLLIAFLVASASIDTWTVVRYMGSSPAEPGVA